MSQAIRGATQRATVGKPTGVFEQAVSGKRTAGSPAVARVGAGATAGYPPSARQRSGSRRDSGLPAEREAAKWEPARQRVTRRARGSEVGAGATAGLPAVARGSEVGAGATAGLPA